MSDEPCSLIYGYCTFEEEPRWYVGSTSAERQQARMKEHERLDGSAKDFHDFLREEMAKTGKAFYEIVKYAVLGICYGDWNDRKCMEDHWIVKKNARRRGFNGGLAGGMPDWTDPIMRANHAEKISKANRGKKRTEETREKIGKANLERVRNGTHHFLKQTGENNPVHQKIADGTHNFQTNHPNNHPEIRAKMTESLKQTCFLKRESLNLTPFLFPDLKGQESASKRV